MDTAAAPDRFSRPSKFVERYHDQGWTEGQIRWLIFNAKDNGLEQAGAIVRVGRRVFIDETKFFSWMRRSRA